MINLIKYYLEKWFQIHFCREFTSWKSQEARFSRIADRDDNSLLYVRAEKIYFTKRWQERCCTICGKIQQKELKW